MKRVSAAKFKEQCLALLDRIDPEGLVITKRGKPIARLRPHDEQPAQRIGCLRGKIEVKGDIVSTGLDLDTRAEP